jgi:hypothetical protein
LLKRLGIEEDKFDDLVFQEVDVPKEGMKWMTLCRFHRTNFFNPQMFEQHMRFAWSPAKAINITPLKDDLFSIKSEGRRRWPWLFCQNTMSIEPYDGLSSP